MNDQRFYSLVELKNAANKACGDNPLLYCSQARMWLDEHGERGYSVLIEGVAPDDLDIQATIWGRLSAIGFEGVEVVTEWEC